MSGNRWMFPIYVCNAACLQAHHCTRCCILHKYVTAATTVNIIPYSKHPTSANITAKATQLYGARRYKCFWSGSGRKKHCARLRHQNLAGWRFPSLTGRTNRRKMAAIQERERAVTGVMWLQIFRDRLDQARCDRRLKAEGGDTVSRRLDNQIQTGESDNVCVGNPRPTSGRKHLYARKHTERQLDKQVTRHESISDFTRQARLGLRLLVVLNRKWRHPKWWTPFAATNARTWLCSRGRSGTNCCQTESVIRRMSPVCRPSTGIQSAGQRAIGSNRGHM